MDHKYVYSSTQAFIYYDIPPYIMETQTKTPGKTGQVLATCKKTAKQNKKAELVFVDGKPTKESMLLVIPSLLEELDQNELNNIYGTVWNITAWKMLYKHSKKEAN